MAYSNINEYLHELRKHLKNLPNKETESLIEEIKSHLYEEVQELTKKGVTKEAALTQVISNFKTPYELSQEYLA